MQKLFSNLAKLFALVVMSGFGLVNHAAAMPSSMLNMTGMDHDSSLFNSSRCASLCTSMVFGKEDTESPVYDENDDEPTPPFYTQIQASYFYTNNTKNHASGLSLRPPPKVPIFIRYQVFRV